MIDKTETWYLDIRWRLIRVLWVALFVGLAICLVVANTIDYPNTTTRNTAVDSISRYVIYAMSLLVLITSHVIRRATTTGKARFDRWLELIPLFHLITDSYPGPARVNVARYVTGTLVQGALIGVLGIYGLALRIAAADFVSLYALVGISAVLLVLQRPRKRELISLAEEAKRTG